MTTLVRNSALIPMPASERLFGWRDHAALWLSLGVGLLVMQVGSYLMPALGTRAAALAIVCGSVLGAGLLAQTAKLGCDSGLSSAGLMHAAYGSSFARLPVLLNIVQLIGWTTFELVVMRDGVLAIARQAGLLEPIPAPGAAAGARSATTTTAAAALPEAATAAAGVPEAAPSFVFEPSLSVVLVTLSSVFVPLYGVILGRLGARADVATLVGGARVNAGAVAIWLLGVTMFHLLPQVSTQLGSALPTLALTFLLAKVSRTRQPSLRRRTA